MAPVTAQESNKDCDANCFEFPKLQLARIARAQRRVVWFFLGCIAINFLYVWARPFGFVLGVLWIFFAYDLARVIGVSGAGLWSFTVVIPGIGLLTLLALSSEASKILAAHGLKVSLFGVSDEQLQTLELEPEPNPATTPRRIVFPD